MKENVKPPEHMWYDDAHFAPAMERRRRRRLVTIGRQSIESIHRVSTQQQTIQFSLEQLRRMPWPETPSGFGNENTLGGANNVTRDLEEVAVRASRWTCTLRDHSLVLHMARGREGPILIHGLDADLAIPLQLYWMLRHHDRLIELCATLKSRYGVDARLVLPGDLPSRWASKFKRVPGIEWADPKYPAAHHRMLPHVLGMATRRPLVLDAVAGVDLANALSGDETNLRPIAICDLDRSEPVCFKTASRDDSIAAHLHTSDNPRWIAGPRWRRRVIDPQSAVGDGELVFHADRVPAAKQSPCVRCGWCEYICPTRCSPAEFLRAQRDHDQVRAKRAGLDSCIDCGLCTNVCPSNLPLFEFIDRLRTGSPEVTAPSGEAS